MQRGGDVGLGDMGMSMAKHLVKQHFEVTGCAVREESGDEAAGQPDRALGALIRIDGVQRGGSL